MQGHDGSQNRRDNMFIKMKVRFWIRKQQGQPSSQLGILYATITINKIRSLPFSTGVSICKKYWDSKLQQVLGKHNVVLNDELAQVKTDLLTIKQQLQNARKNVTAESVRDEWLRQQNGPGSLLALMNQHEIYQRKYGKGKKGKPLTEGTFKLYKSNRAYLKDYLEHCKNISLNPEQINGKWLINFEDYLKSRIGKPLTQSTVNYAITYIKQVLKFALSNESIRVAPGIFYKLNPIPPTVPKPLTEKEIKLLEDATLTDKQRKAVDCFLFLRYTGMHYIDGFQLTESSIQIDENGNEYLALKRQKTEEPAYIPYHTKAKAIANKYGGISKLPFTTFDNMNARLKRAALTVGILRNITPGTARDTFADYCSNTIKVSDESLAAMLGHSSTVQVKKYRRISIRRIIAEWKE
jgi:integrase